MKLCESTRKSVRRYASIEVVRRHVATKVTQRDATKTRPIKYIDANNLHGWAMSQYLPCGNFELRHPNMSENVRSFNDELKFLMNIPPNHKTGYTYEVDLHVLRKLHDYFSDLSPVPEKTFIEYSRVSSYQKKKTRKETTTKSK